MSGAFGAFVGTASSELTAKTWEESQSIRDKMSYTQVTLAIIAGAGVVAIALAASAFLLHKFGLSKSEILSIAGSTFGDPAGIGLAFAVLFFGGLAVRKAVQMTAGKEQKLIDNHYWMWPVEGDTRGAVDLQEGD